MPGHAEAAQTLLKDVMQNKELYREVLISVTGCRSLCKAHKIAQVHCVAVYILSCLLNQDFGCSYMWAGQLPIGATDPDTSILPDKKRCFTASNCSTSVLLSVSTKDACQIAHWASMLVNDSLLLEYTYSKCPPASFAAQTWNGQRQNKDPACCCGYVDMTSDCELISGIKPWLKPSMAGLSLDMGLGATWCSISAMRRFLLQTNFP